MNNLLKSILALVFVITILIIYKCNKTKPGCYDDNCMNDIICVLKYTANKLNKFNIRWWIDFGTLLGVYRGDGIIYGDDDADFSYDARDTNKLFEMFEEIKKENTYSITNSGWCREPYKIINTKTGAVVDLFPFHISGNKMLSSHSSAYDSNVDDIYPLREFYSDKLKILLPIPNRPVARLTQKYGDDFMIPQDKKGKNGKFIRTAKVIQRCVPMRFNNIYINHMV